MTDLWALSSQQLLSNIFEAPAPDADANADAFLKDYLMNKRWVGGDAGEEDEEEDDDLSEDEELTRAEHFETKYNFRFEEPGSGALMAQPRRPEGLIRKPDTSRADKRRAKAERKEDEKERLREELKRLKNLKKKEIEAKLKAIASVAGTNGLPTGISGAALDDDEWDEGAHEAMMRGAFGEEYYQQSDDDEEQLTKPEFGDMDEELQQLLASAWVC